VAKLCDKGYDNLPSRDTWKFAHDFMIVARCTKCSHVMDEDHPNDHGIDLLRKLCATTRYSACVWEWRKWESST